MRIRKIAVLAVILFASVGSILAQQPETSGVIKTAKGMLVVWNEPGNYYTLEIKADKIEPVPDRTLWFMVNGRLLQVLTVEKKQVLTETKKAAANDRAMLELHRDWESDYIGKTLNSKPKIVSAWLKTGDNMDALAWSFDMPKVVEGQTAIKQLYLGVVKGDHVFLLNTVVETNDDEKVLTALLVETLATLKPTTKPLSLQKASEQVKKGN